MTDERPAAVVVGLCAHGLAISRALAREGVEVHAVEANLALPGAATRCATIHAVRDINTPVLIDELLELRVATHTVARRALRAQVLLHALSSSVFICVHLWIDSVF